MDEAILQGKYPAKSHARKVASYLGEKGLPRNGVMYLEGGKSRLHEDSDQEAIFRSVLNLTPYSCNFTSYENHLFWLCYALG